MRHLMALMMAMMGIFFCLMGLAILQTLDDMTPQPPKKRKKKVARRRKKITRHAKNPPTTDPKTSHLNALPVEVLMHIFEYLAPDNVQPHLDGMSLRAYKRAQNVLQNVCLVSKRMEAVARRFLYQGVIIKNADALAYFLRTLDENQDLGQKVKRLVFEVPCALEDEHYQKPNVALLESRPKFREIQEAADMIADFEQYQEYCARMRELWSDGGPDDTPDQPFREWAWEKECRVISLMHFEILLLTTNLESLCFGSITEGWRLYIPAYWLFLDTVGFTLQFRVRRESMKPVVTFLSKLTNLEMLTDNKDDKETYPAGFLEPFLRIPSLRTLKSFRDDGDWAEFDPYATRSEETLRKSSWHIPSFEQLKHSSQHWTLISCLGF